MKDLTKFPKLAYNGLPEQQYLGKEGLKLVNKLIELYAYYDDQQWLDETGQPLTPSKLAAARNLDYLPTMLVANLGAWLVDELAKFMFQKTPSLSCPPEQIDTAEDMAKPDYKPSERQTQANAVAAAREQLLYRMAKQNTLPEKLLQAGRDYHIAGGVACKLHYDPLRGLRFIWRPRLEYWPTYDADDADVLTRVVFTGFADGREDVIWKQEYWLEGYDEAKVAAAAGQAWTPPLCWMKEGLYEASTLKLQKELVPPTNTELPFIPVMIFPAKTLTGETEGRSTLARVQSLLDELNAKLSDNADSLRFGMFGVTIIKNAVLPSPAEIKAGKAAPLVKAPNALWALNGGGTGVGGARVDPDAKVLEHNFSYREALEYHLNAIERLVHKISNVPQIDAEKIQGLGDLSGIAIRMLYGPIISATDETMTVWVPRLQRLFGYALLMLQRYEAKRHYPEDLLRQAGLDGPWSPANLPFNPDDVAEVLPRLPLPQNEVEQLDYHVKKVTALLETTKDAMDALGEENPEAKLAEVLAEKQQISEAFGDMMQISAEQQGTIDRTDPDPKGGAGNGGDGGRGQGK